MTKSYIQGHPRPQFTRPEWENLNGKWEFSFDDSSAGEDRRWYEVLPDTRSITVPFTYETAMSGIGDETFHPVVWYSRSFTPKFNGKRIILNFEGSDYITKVWVNGIFVGSHKGGYTRFGFDITRFVKETGNIITIRVEDSDDLTQPRGKQRWERENFGCWYVQTTGIWKTVWVEYLPEVYLENVRMTPRLDDKILDLEWKLNRGGCNELNITAEVTYNDIKVNMITLPIRGSRGKASIDVSSAAVDPWSVRTWSPDKPELYDIKFTLINGENTVDAVWSYFGMRDIRTEGNRVLLNNRPIYQRLILDQGYWKESGLTPPDEDSIKNDIIHTKKLGYNGARKHQKIEDERYAYWCDVLGLLMWCEMPSAYEFGNSAVIDFTAQWTEVVEQHYNHPSIVTWTAFNESWGVAGIKRNRSQQRFTEAIYHLTKALDGTRPVIVNDGWEHTVSDIITLHDYEESAETFLTRYQDNREAILNNGFYYNLHRTALAQGFKHDGKPVIISEYGGAAYYGGKEEEWGYGAAVENEEKLLERIRTMTDAIKSLTWICGYCYTQLTDVEQEINGLMDTNRSYKASQKVIWEINTGEEYPED